MTKKLTAVARCTARESGGARCELPAGHDGEHACPEALARFLASRRMVVLVFGLLAGCGGSVSYGAPYMALEAPSGMRDVGAGPVEGRDCSFALFGSPARSMTAERAMHGALEGTGATALRDAEIELVSGFETCIVVRGTAVVERGR